MPEISFHCNFGLFGGHRCQLVHYGFGRYSAHVTHQYTGDEATATYMSVLYLKCTAIAALFCRSTARNEVTLITLASSVQ
jgi:hypothetical protein